MKKSLLLSLGILTFCSSCQLFGLNARPDYIVDLYPAVYKLKDINTKFDDYNSAAPPASKSPRKLATDTMFIYSTNSGSEGKNFDIWKGKLTLEQKSRLKGQKNPAPIIKSERIAPFLNQEVNTESNEFGPYLFYYPTPEKVLVSPPPKIEKDYNGNFNFSTSALKNDDPVLKSYNEINDTLYSDYLAKKDDKELLGANLYFFASDRKGKLDIYYYSPKFGIREFFGNQENSNERYISYDYKRNTVYFSSDRDGKYKIYKYVNKTGDLNFENVFNKADLAKDIVKADELNSEGNDTCPVVVGDYMVFASDRSGTKGGYDIYISYYREPDKYIDSEEYDKGWSKPKNLQDEIDEFYKSFSGKKIPKEDLKDLNLEINTKYDEFRPFIIEDPYNSQYSEINHVSGSGYLDNPSDTYANPNSIIFSSNRPGGKGGFDLHLAILPYLANYNRSN